MFCRNCGLLNETDATRCVRCGGELSRWDSKSGRIVLLVIALLLAIVIGVGVLLYGMLADKTEEIPQEHPKAEQTAPVEQMEFEEVDYWEELCEIMEWSKHNVYSTLHICWGAQAGLYYHYGIPKYELDYKLSGIFQHRVLNPNHPLMRGFDDRFVLPHSRYTGVHREEISKHPELEILATSRMAGVAVVCSKDGRQFFVMGHGEYDRNTLATEYFRDLNKGINPAIPHNYFPEDDPQATPPLTWRSNATMLFTNWLNYYVYQKTNGIHF